jgi:hypothetical protein
MAVAIIIISVSAILQAIRKPQFLVLFKNNAIVRKLFAQKQYAPVIWILLCWIVVTVVASFVVSQGPNRIFSVRYMTVIVAAVCLLAGTGVMVLRIRMVQVVLALLLVVVASLQVPQYYRDAQVEDWNSTSHWLIQHYQDNDGLVCYDNAITQGCQIAMEYYLHTYSDTVRFAPDSPGAFSWEKFGPADPVAGFDAALDKDMLASYMQKHKRLFFIVGRLPDDAAARRVEAVEQWLSNQYLLVGQIMTPTVIVQLYQMR